MKEPSDFLVFPIDSVLQNTESEIVALNVMKILATTDDQWRELSTREYVEHRENDGNYSSRELGLLTKVKPYLKSEDTARLFSSAWANI